MMKKIFKHIVLASTMVAALGMTSCEDFLTIHPSNRITEEEFWQDKNDLTSGLGACYSQMVTSSMMSRVIEWGEFRSDNLILDDKSNNTLQNLQSGILRPTESMFDWSAFYKEINLCNKVLEHGQDIFDKGLDKSLTKNEWNGMKAEALTLRALSYFYLVRSFRNVPAVYASISTDKEAYNSKIPQTLGVNILGKLISDLEEAKTYARKDFGANNSVYNKGRITSRAVYSLLADVYLWRGCMLKKATAKGDSVVVAKLESGADTTYTTQADMDKLSNSDFNKSIENAQAAIKMLTADRDALYIGFLVKPELPEYPFIYNGNGSGEQTVGSVTDKSYNEVFVSGNSQESIFELQVDGTNTTNKFASYLVNGDKKNTVGTMQVNASLDRTGEKNPASGFGKLDIRSLENSYNDGTSKTAYVCMKGAASTIAIENAANMTKGATYINLNTFSTNMLIYRLSDVMLIEAEAIARKNSPSNAELVKGINLVNEVFKRAHPGASKLTTDDEVYIDRMTENFATSGTATGNPVWNAATLLSNVYVERQREFLGEGKRWFDLVRKVEAENSTAGALDLMGASKAIKVQLNQFMSFYNPVYDTEMKANTNLKQNPVWANQ